MTKLIAKTNFSWAHRGCDVVGYEDGQEIETDDRDLIGVATAEGWAEEVGEDGKSAAKTKVKKAA